MKLKTITKVCTLALAAVASATFAPVASAAVVGHLSLGICVGGSVIATLNTLDFILPVQGGNGCDITGAATTVTYTGDSGVLGSTTGTVNDLCSATPGAFNCVAAGFPAPGASNANFLFFPTNPNLHFDLTLLGPGPSNVICDTTFTTAGDSCAVFLGSPFTLTTNGTGTSISLGVRGVAHDLSSVTSNWSGAFTFQIDGIAPATIQAVILGTSNAACGASPAGSHACESTWSFEGNATAVPEPMTTSMIGAGLIGFAFLVKRRLQA